MCQIGKLLKIGILMDREIGQKTKQQIANTCARFRTRTQKVRARSYAIQNNKRETGRHENENDRWLAPQKYQSHAPWKRGTCFGPRLLLPPPMHRLLFVRTMHFKDNDKSTTMVLI